MSFPSDFARGGGTKRRMVVTPGFEPGHLKRHQILSLTCLPIPSRDHGEGELPLLFFYGLLALSGAKVLRFVQADVCFQQILKKLLDSHVITSVSCFANPE